MAPAAILILLLPLLSPCSASAAPDREIEPAAPQDTLTILFTAETRGNLEPCRCPTRPLGGLARRVGFLRHCAQRAGGTVLVLDAGGFLPEGTTPLRDRPGVAAQLVSLLLESFDRADVYGFAMDHRQREFLVRTAPRAFDAVRAAALCADPPDPHRLFFWNGRTAAILSLEETLADSTVRRAARCARAEAEILIVLARADGVSGRRLARLSSADLVLLSRGARLAEPLTEGGSILVGSGTEGREVGEIRLLPAARARTDGTDAPRLRVVEFRLHAMGSETPEDAATAVQVGRLLEDAGPRASARAETPPAPRSLARWQE